MQARQKVSEVKKIRLDVEEKSPWQLAITVAGVVPSKGYTGAQLMPAIYKTPPPDGMYDFDFVAIKPGQASADVITIVVASYDWADFPSHLRGVRIHAAANKMEQFIVPVKMG